MKSAYYFITLMGVAAIVFASTISVGPSHLQANQDDSTSSNCFDQVCFGPVHIFIENASETETQTVRDLSCRLTGINLTVAQKDSLQKEAEWSNYHNLVLFVNDLENTRRIHPKLVSPADLSAESTRFGGTLSIHSNNRIHNTEYLAFDQLKSGCNDWRCWVGVTYQFLEVVYGQKILVDQEKFGDGEYCAAD